MTPHPKFSIVTPSLNQAQFLEENIRSVLAQQYPDFEHIIIDGGSSDGTLTILKKYPHLRWISEPDNGQTHALNKGFRMASGEIVGWLNADDSYCPGIFERVADMFAASDVEVLYGDGYETDEEGRVIRDLISRGITFEGLLKYWKWDYEFVQPAFFFRRTVFDEVGFLDESLYYAMDYEFILRLCRRCALRYLPQPLANLRLHSKSKTGKVFQKIIPDYIREMQAVSWRHWGTLRNWKFYCYLFSFVGAIIGSFFKNIFFVKGSKSRTFLGRLKNAKR